MALSTDWTLKIATYLQHLAEEKRLQLSSLKLYQRDLLQLCEHLQSASTASNTLRTTLASLSPSTHQRKLIVWQNFLSQQPEPYRSLLKDFKKPKVRFKQPKFLNENESFLLETACYKTKNVTRDRLFIGLCLELGLRLQELLHIRFGDIEDGYLKLVRKGGKEQRLPLNAATTLWIQTWKKERQANAESYLFEGRNGGPLTPRAGQYLLARLAKSVQMKKISPHALRHTFATTLASRGANLVALKEILGHQSLKTTERYMHVTPEHLKETLNLLKRQRSIDKT